jgi:hypothetical protein
MIQIPLNSIHTLIRRYGQSEVKEISGIGEIGLHCQRQIQLRQIYGAIARINRQPRQIFTTGLKYAPFCTRIWAALVFGFFLAAASSFFFILHI